MASLYAAGQPNNGLNGVIWLAGVIQNRHYDFQPGYLASVGCPIKIISANQDPYGAADDAHTLHAWAKGTSELDIIPGTRHGTEILTEGDPSAAHLTTIMIDFVERVSTGSTDTC